MLVTEVTDIRIPELWKHSSLESEDSVSCVDAGLRLTCHIPVSKICHL